MVQIHEKYGENEITCPYCGYEFSDSWEYRQECDEEECCECGKKFHWSRNVSVDYTSKPDCKLNGEEHVMSDWEYFDHTDSWGDRCFGRKKECEVCGETEYEFGVEEELNK